MIVQCDQCSTKFRLDDSKVTEAGVRVRCSKCKYIFVVKKETAADEPDFDTLLQGFEESPDTRSAEPARQASPSDALESFGDDEAHEVVRDRGFSLEDTSIGDEPPSPFDPTAFVRDEEPASPSFSPDEIDFSSVRLSVEREIAEEEPADAPPLQNDDFDFGEFEQESEAAPAASEQAFSGAGDFGFVTEIEGDEGASSFNPADFISDSPLVPDEPSAGSIPAHEEAGKEGQSFLFEDKEPSAAFSFPSAAGSDIFGSSDDFLRDEDASAATPETDEEPVPPAIAEEPPFAVSRRQSSSVFPIAITAVAVIFILAIAGAGVYFLKEGPQAFEKLGLGFMAGWFGLEAKEEGKITLKNVEAFYLKNTEAGELFIIKGEALNEYKKPRASIQVKGIVYGKNNSELAQKTIYCGNVLTKEQLATLPVAKMEQIMNNQFGDSLANLGVAPGKAIPFVIAIANVPKEGTDYGVEVSGSTVASQ